jgi:hypothetical protein
MKIQRYRLEKMTANQGFCCTKDIALTFEEARDMLAADKSLRIYGAGDRKDFNKELERSQK